MNIPTEYQLNGFADRKEYLESLCEEYPRDTVYALASILGSSEDFDGLVTSLEDYSFGL
jgi:hypothetical protein